MKDFRHIRSHKFRDRRYRVKWRKPRDGKDGVVVNGCCEDPTGGKPSISINPSLSEEEFLAVAIDETLHACFFDLDNLSVDEASEDISNFLWRVGFRLTNSKS